MQTPLELMRHATMTTTDGQLNAAEQAQVLAAVIELQNVESISDVQLSRILRCSRATWSQIRNGLYRGRTETYLARARRWMAERVERAAAPAVDYVDTSIGRNIMKVCSRAWSMPTMALVLTPSGCGKTAALAEFARRRGDRALYLQAGEACNVIRELLVEISAGLRLPVSVRYTAGQLYRSVRDRLADYYAGGKADPYCLIIDEATTLRPRCLNVLRNLHDDPACRAAVILADTWRLDAELHSRHGIAGGYEQLRSRFGARYVLAAAAAISPRDVKAVGASVLAGLGHAGAIHAESWRYLHDLAQADGKLRNVVQRLWAVHDVAMAAGADPTYSVAECDFVADLVGGRRTLEHAEIPFGKGSGVGAGKAVA